MHKLDRSNTPAPVCLSHYRHGLNNWKSLNPTDKQEIHQALETLQGKRCAYCECDLDQHGEHIEHFRQRDRYPKGTFDWDNLFWSCLRDDSCGQHKDRCGMYNHADLIKPDIEDPEHFFLFVVDGSITVRASLMDAEKHRANETLRIFNLDAQWGPLRKMRQLAVMGHLETIKTLQELAPDYELQELVKLIEQELEEAKKLPFCTAIKHVLTPQ